MRVKQYNLHKTVKKTATENNLVFVNGNEVTDNKLLFDFSFLDNLDIAENEKEAIKAESFRHCSIANNTVFVFYNEDKFTTCNAVIDFNYHRVYNSKTWKRAYVIMEVKHVKYFHGERNSIYDKFYTENVKEFEVDSNTCSPLEDLEV